MIKRGNVRLSMVMAFLTLALFGSLGTQLAAAQTPTTDSPGLAAVKQTIIDQLAIQKGASEQLVRFATRYQVLAEGAGNDYQVLWDGNTPETAGLLAAIKGEFVKASTAYEMNTSLLSGIPAFASLDAWIGSSPSGEEDAAGAYVWTLELADGTKIENPGNILHDLAEQVIWGTNEAYVVLRVDLNADGTIADDETLPDAQVLLAAAQALDDATAKLQTAVNAWEPNRQEILTALVTSLPGLSAYVDQWKNSVAVAGDKATDASYVAASRLADLNNRVQGLLAIYNSLGEGLDGAKAKLFTAVQSLLNDLATYVGDLVKQEIDGTTFNGEQIDAINTALQEKSAAVSQQLTRLSTLLGS